MPYDAKSGPEVAKMKARLEKTYSSVSDTAARQAIHILNSVMEKHDEGRAWQSIHSQMKERGLSKKKKAAFIKVPARIAKAVAAALANLIRDAEIPLEERQKANHFYELASDSGNAPLRKTWVDERLWDKGADFIYGDPDYDVQNERVENLEGEVNDLLIRMGVIGRRAKAASQAKKAGFFSWQCMGCGKSLLSEMAAKGKDFDWMKDVVAVFEDGSIIKGEYDGYGRIDTPSGADVAIVDDMYSKDGPSLWHDACWKKKGRPGWKGPSKNSRDQGWFFDDEDYEGTQPGRRTASDERTYQNAHQHAKGASRLLEKIGRALYDSKYAKVIDDALRATTDLELVLEAETKGRPMLANEIEKLAQKHPEHAAALRAISKEAVGWVPGELREDHQWEGGVVDNTPSSHREEGSQVPPARSSYGEQINAEGNPVESLERLPKQAGQFDWDDDRIVHYFDSHPNVMLRDLARMTGRTVPQLKRLLMGDRRAAVEDSWSKLANKTARSRFNR